MAFDSERGGGFSRPWSSHLAHAELVAFGVGHRDPRTRPDLATMQNCGARVDQLLRDGLPAVGGLRGGRHSLDIDQVFAKAKAIVDERLKRQ